MTSYIRWIPSFRITQEHRKKHFCLQQWLNANVQGVVLERHLIFPRRTLLASNCSQFMRTLKLDVVCVYLLTFGRFLSHVLEHPWIQQKFFASWASFDKTSYHPPSLSILSLTSFSMSRSCSETLHKHYTSMHIVHSIPEFTNCMSSLCLLFPFS